MPGHRIPVYTDDGGVPRVLLYEEEGEGGFFRRTTLEPLRMFKEHIAGISAPVGTLMSSTMDRSEREWDSPTAQYQVGRPQSFYRLLRETSRQRKIIVLTCNGQAARATRFQMHELRLKNTASSSVIGMMLRKYREALESWNDAIDAKNSDETPQAATSPDQEKESG